MKARRFLFAFVLLAITSRALAQGGGRMPPVKPDNSYARGFNAGRRDAIAWKGDGDSFHRAGYLREGNSVSHETYDDGYKDGYNAGMGFDGSGKSGFGGISVNGVDIGNPLSYPANAANYQRAYQQQQEWRAQTHIAEVQRHASHRAQHEALHPHATPEELAAFNKARLPAPLSVDEFDPAKGVIQWPAVLKRREFDDSRTKLEGLFRQAAANPHGSGVGTQNYRDIVHVVDEMHDQLHSEIAQFTPKAYIAASKFLKSLAYRAKGPSK